MTTYHVSTAGNNSNSGTTSGQAWRTINYANGRMVSGDSLIVHPGVYAEFVYLDTENVTVIAPTGAIIDGTTLNWGADNDWNYRYLVRIIAPHVRFEGFEVRNGTAIKRANGIKIGAADGDPWIQGQVVISNCHVHHISENGITGQWQNGLIVENCTVHDVVLNNTNHILDSTEGAHGGGIGLMGVDNGKVINCDVYNLWGEGILTDFDSDTIEFAYNRVRNHISQGLYGGHVHNLHIHHNVDWHTDDSTIGTSTTNYRGNGFGVYDEAYDGRTYGRTYKADIHDNLVVNANVGFWMSTSQSYHSSTTGSMENVRVYHNTFINCNNGLQVYWYHVNDFVNCELKNNTWYVDSGITDNISAGMTGITFDYNSWTSAPSALATGGNDQIGNQAFVDLDAAINGISLDAINFDNYRTLSTSTGTIDNGVTGLTLNNGYSLGVDFYGLTRGASNIDIGCHEYDGTVVEPPDTGLLVAQDAGRMGLHGSHVDTVILESEARGRYFDGSGAHVRLQQLAGKFTPEAGTMGIWWKADAGTHTESQTRHIVEIYRYDNTSGNSDFWIIRQNGDNTITFTVMIDGTEITPITVANSSYSAQFLGLTWDSAGVITGYVDATATSTQAYPNTYVEGGDPSFIHIGQGGESYNMRGMAADFVFIRGKELSGAEMSTLSAAVLADTLDATTLDGLSGDWSWYGLYDDELIDPGDPTEVDCILTADVTTGAVPLAVTFDWSTSVFDPNDPVDHYLLYVQSPFTVINTTDTDYTHNYTQVGIGRERAVCVARLESGEQVFSNSVDIYLTDPQTLPTYPLTDAVVAIEARCDLLETASTEFLAMVSP